MYMYGYNISYPAIYISHTSQKGLDDACVFPEMSPETDPTYGLHNVNKEKLYSPGGRPVSVQLRFIVSWLWTAFNTRSKRFNEEIILHYCPGGRYAIFHSGSLFTLFTWLWPAL